MSRLMFFPKLNQRIIKKIKYKSTNYKFSFKDPSDKTKLELKVDQDHKKIVLDDQNNRWLYRRHNLILEKNIEFNTKDLFGKSGIAPTNSTVGLIFKYYSQRSLHRGYKLIKSFDQYENKIDIRFIYSFNENEILDDIECGFYLCIITKDTLLADEERHLSNLPGTIIGSFETLKIQFDSEKNQFPTEKIDDKNEPLWQLKVNYDLHSEIDESIVLQLNKAHKDYPLFDPSQKEKYNIEFIKEVMSMVVVILLGKAKDDFDLLEMDDYEDGTLGYLLSYYKKAFNLKSNEIEEIHSAVVKGIRL